MSDPDQTQVFIATVPQGAQVLDNFLFCCLHNLGVMMDPERPIEGELREEWNAIERGGGS